MLYVVGTPIGNLSDATYRMVEVLKSVDIIAAEDTRNTAVLCKYFDISTPLTSYHEHNKKEKGIKLLEKLKNGDDIAIVTDAGMPGISDPGEDLIKLCIENNIKINVVPGPTAFASAVVISGLSAKHFYFEGFLPVKNPERNKRFEEIKNKKETIILYEAPHKLLKTLNDILKIMGDRNISLCRELTKKYEEVKRGKVSELIDFYTNNSPKGEFVCVIEGANEIAPNFEISIVEHVMEFIKNGYTKKEAILKVSALRGLPKREIYNEFERSNVNKL